MNIDNHNQRRDFLNLKVKTGLPLTPEEQAEYERLKSVRVVMTTDNVLIVERPPETTEQWAARILERNLAHRARQEREENARNNGQSYRTCVDKLQISLRKRARLTPAR